MTAVGRSGRSTDRVGLRTDAATETVASDAASAPEILTRSQGETSRQASPERGARSAPTKRVSDSQLQRLRRSLSERDLLVLQSISTYRFLTTTQVRDFHFHDHATPASGARVCRRVLLRLSALDVIEELGRRVGGIRAGSDAFIWRVGKLGDRLLQLEHGRGARARRKEPSERFLDHCLDIASAHLALLTAQRAGELQLLTVQTEPATWRSYLGPSGEHLTLKPDLLAVTATNDYEDSWALEIDEGTESIPSLITKCAQYEAYRATGREQTEHGVFPLVVWIVPTEHRAARLDAALSRAQRLDRTLYRVCTPDRLLDVIRGGAA